MVLAVEDTFQGGIIRWRNGTAPVRAFEAGLVVGLSFNCHLQDLYLTVMHHNHCMYLKLQSLGGGITQFSLIQKKILMNQDRTLYFLKGKV